MTDRVAFAFLAALTVAFAALWRVTLVEAAQTYDHDRIGAVLITVSQIAEVSREERDRLIRIETTLELIGRKLGVETQQVKAGE